MLKYCSLLGVKWVCAALFFGAIYTGVAAERQVLHGHVPSALARFNLQPTGRLPVTKNLHLAIGLPLRNQQGLDDLLRQIYDPASPNYRHYLTPEQIAEQFGPSEQDYQSYIAFERRMA
jgi:kumamolisin